MARFLNAAAPGLILPRGESYWTSPEMYDWKSARPSYTRAETSMFFFGRSARWFKQHVLDGDANDGRERIPAEIIDNLDLARDGRGRKYKLFHIEVIANELADRRIIDGRQFLYCIEMLRIQACLWGFGDAIEDLSRRAAREREM